MKNRARLLWPRGGLQRESPRIDVFPLMVFTDLTVSNSPVPSLPSGPVMVNLVGPVPALSDFSRALSYEVWLLHLQHTSVPNGKSGMVVFCSIEGASGCCWLWICICRGG